MHSIVTVSTRLTSLAGIQQQSESERHDDCSMQLQLLICRKSPTAGMPILLPEVPGIFRKINHHPAPNVYRIHPAPNVYRILIWADRSVAL